MTSASPAVSRRALLSVAAIPLVAALLPAAARAQSPLDSLIRTPLDGAPSPASPLDLLLPAPIRVGYMTRAWVRDSLPPASDTLDDLARLDMIYVRAIGESSGDLGMALFASLIACFEHRTIPFSFGLHLPLTLEPQEAFVVAVDGDTVTAQLLDGTQITVLASGAFLTNLSEERAAKLSSLTHWPELSCAIAGDGYAFAMPGS